MTRWWRRAFFLIGLLIALPGMLAAAVLPVVVGIVMVLASLLPTRADPSLQSAPSGHPLVEAEGQTWMQQPDGSWLRWRADETRWEDVGPPPPEVIRNRPSSAPEQIRTVSKALTIVLVLFLAAGAWALIDPQAQIPGVSPAVCSLKGGTWHDAGSVIIPAGCYPREEL